MEKMIMMKIRSSENPTIDSTSNESAITTISTCPTWKLYENPFYYSPQKLHNHPPNQIHHTNLPISARKFAASFWNLRFIGPVMDADDQLDLAKAQIIQLKAELEFEKKTRKKMESVNKKLNRELSEEKEGKMVLERVCEELGKKIIVNKAEMSKMKREIEEERKMLRMAEVFREERVQMKLTEAKYVLHEKILELEEFKRTKTGIFPSSSLPEMKDGIRRVTTDCSIEIVSRKNEDKNENSNPNPPESNGFSGEVKYVSDQETPSCKFDSHGIGNSVLIQRPEPENPHIKRGIKGFVEFPKVVRAIGSKSRHFGTRLECQKAQLRLLLNQKSSIKSNNLIMS